MEALKKTIGLLLLCWFGALASPLEAAGPRRIIVLGFDGADARLTEQWMEEGALPNLKRLREEGDYRRLRPTNPPQTPVSWSSFATGTDPGRNRIFDFLKRDPATYYPSFALMEDTATERVLWGERTPLLFAGAGAAIGLALFLALARPAGWGRALAIGIVAGAILSGGMYAGADLWIPQEKPKAVNNRWGRTFWEIADDAGVRSRVLRVPATFPANHLGCGKMISGLGVPDMRQTIGQPTVYTSDPTLTGGDNEFSVRIVQIPAQDTPVATTIPGPKNVLFYAPKTAEEEKALQDRGVPKRIDIPLTIRYDAASDRVTVSTCGKEATLGPREWSDWFELEFPFNWLVKARGIARFYVIATRPHLTLYLGPLHFHPSTSGRVLPFCWPPGFGADLAGLIGLYKTMGWSEDTWTISSGIADEEHFLSDMNMTVAKEVDMMRALLPQDERLYVQVYSYTDRIAHVLWRFMDPGHPLYDAGKAPRFQEEVKKAYVRMDGIVGEAMAQAGPDDVLLVLSDHGFASYRRGLNINTWLARNGFMGLRGASQVQNLDNLFGRSGSFFENVDWSRTQAYSLGLGAVYINLMGREKQGIVAPGEQYRDVCRKIREGLEAYVDPATGEKPVARVYHRDEIYRDYDATLIPDLRVANTANYRVSWQTTLGATPPDIMEDNLKAWSGDHCSVDPSIVPGILFANRKIGSEDPCVTDVGMSVLRLLNLPVPEDSDGRPFF